MSSQGRCPDPEVLAAFVAGALSGNERESTAGHVCSCVDCLAIVRLAALVEREEALVLPAPPSHRQASRWPWWLAAAAALLPMLLANVWIQSSRPSGLMRTLVAAAPRHERKVEPRISGGFAWAPLAMARRGGGPSIDPETMKLVGAAGEVLEQTAGNRSSDAQHAAAVAHLLSGSTHEAAATLKKLAAVSTDARVWSDLAAAAYTASLERGGDPARLTEALAASERALQLDAQFLEALFNRALILERLGLERQAREAWDRYLSADPRSNWATEATRHRGMLTPGPDGARALPSTSQSVLYTVAQRAASSSEWLNALQLLDRVLEERMTTEQGEVTAELLLMRAFIDARLGLRELARQDLARAQPVIEGIADASIRSRLASASTAVGAILARSPSIAVDMLRAPLEAGKAPVEILAQMHLQRGRSFATLGRLEKATADFDAGIGRIEEASPTVWNTALTRTDLYDAAIELALSRGDVLRAFTYAEHRRTPHAAQVIQVAASGKGAEIFVEYEVIGTNLIIFAVKDGRIHAARRAVEPEKLSSLIADLTSSATTHSTVLFRRAAAELYEHLLEPVAAALEPGRKLVFIPDNSLHAIPFAALVGPDGRYLVEDHAVVIATSATTYASLSARFPASATGPLDLLVVAGPSRNDALGPLFGVQREAMAVARPYRQVTRIEYDGKSLASYAASADVIHFAGHAIDSEDDAAGALVVLDEHGEIGRMDTRQIASLRLRHARLVVLAACNTAGTQNDGIRTSIAEAFLAAGAPSVIGTVWEIDDDAASDFFPRLHSHFAKGASPADALRAAQLETIHRGNPSPVTWAAVQLIGS